MTDAAHMEKIAVVNGQNSSGDEDETVEEEIGGQTQAKKVELELSEVDLNETVENGDAQQEGESPVEEDKIRVEPATISPLPSAGDREKVPVEQEKSSLKMESKPEIVATTPVAEEIETIESLKEKCAKGDMDGHHIVASVSAALVGGVFDLENRFVIRSGDTVLQMVDLLDVCPPKLQAEVWSVFIAIVRKCTKNLEACADVGLITKLLDRLQTADDIVADLFIELLGVLTCYSINVKEMKTFMQALQAKQNIWPKHSTKLLHVLKLMPKKDGPDVFFSFSGNKSAGIALPPIKSWPHQSGWTFSTWFRLDPINSVNFEREKPFLYCFKTSKGLGYSAHFIGNSLVVTSMKVKNKGFQHCFKYEFAPRKWYMVTLAHVYNRWSKSEIRCFVNGQQIDSVEMSWVLSLNEQYDKCHIGCSPEGDSESSFCGQMGSVYCFTEALNVQQINSMYCLGPSYQSQFKYENETNLPDGYKKFLFDGKLSSSLMFAYCPKSCDRQLCLESSPKENLSYFVHTPHALMLQDVKVVVTHSIYSTLHSVGGIQMLLPLFGQLSCAHMKSDGGTFVDYTTCSTLLSVVCQLLELNPNSQQQMFQNKGFLVISHMLQKAEKRHIDESVLDTFLSTAKYLLSSPTGIPLLKQLFDHILFNPGLWIHTAPNIQLKLYSYLANDFLSNHQFYSNIRKVSTILQMIHALKYYYWVTNPEAKSGFTPKGLDGSRPGNHDVVKIRGFLLVFIRKLFLKGDPPKDDELQAILNFLTTVNEDDNLYDFLQSVISLMAEDPASMIPGFDRKQGVCAVYKLLASGNELIRIPALKLLGFFLCRSTAKRKQDTMGPNNLFTLLTDRLILHAAHLSVATYNGLFELLTENVTAELQYCPHPPPEQYYRFENPMILKVIANLISQSKNCDELLEVKKLFINDMIALCSNNSDNRRTILQMSVWQEWLISMAHIFPKNQMEDEISNCVYHLFSILLHHAIKLEYGGWRVWVDTMAIVHSKVSFERFKQDMAKKYNIYEERVSEGETSKRPGSSGLRQSASVDFPRITEKTETLRRASLIDEEVSEEDVVRDIVDSLVDKVSRKFADDLPAKATRTQSTSAKRHRQIFQSEPPRPIYRTPEYKWSDVHIRLLSDLLLAIETDVSAWKGVPHKSLIETVNSSDNTIFVVNAVHMLSQLVDNLVLASGGLLPLLAAATSPNSELEIVDGTQQGLPIDVAVSFLIRFVSLADVLVFASAVNFGELEQEKNMPSGGILRQCLRLVSTVAVRNCLVSREVVKLGGQLGDSKKSEGNKNGKRSVREEAVRLLIRGGMKPEDATSAIMNDNGIPNPDQLLQEMDLSRLKAVIYRDVEETKQAQFLALAVVYFLSVLMVSRYRDILEPPPSPSPFFGTDKGRRESSSAKEESSVTRERRNSNSSSTASTSAMSGDLADSQEKSAAKAAAAQLGGTSEEAEPETNNKVESNGETGGVQEEQNKPERWRVEDEEGSSAEPTPDVPISAINIQQAGPTVDSTAAIEKTKSAAEHQLKAIEPAEVSSSAMAMSSERQASLTSKLRSALDSCAPLLREIMTDFHSFLQRTLLGTHGQEIMNDARVVATLRNQHGSVVELVMLLCSQEWQTSLQKHAGLAFIELVNEGRLLAHATRDHIVRVANEADFILNRLRAEDVTKHADFEAACAQVALNRREEERSCDHLISAARRRDTVVACRVNDKILNLLTSHHGAWTQLEKKEIFWKLDVWEDDSRRRKRLIPNPYGSSHPEATLKAAMEHGGSEQEVEKAREAFLAHLSAKKIFSPSQVPAPQGDEILDESEIGKLMDEKEPEVEISDPTNYSAQCKLIAPGITLPGTISITASEMYFDCNEDDPEFRAQDSKALRYCDNLHGRWHFNEIRAIFLRRFLLENSALEIFLASRTILLAFPDHATVKKVVQHLPRVGVGVKYGLPQSRRASLMSPRQLFKHSDMPQKWQRREISNFDYLMFLNTVAGRTHSDLNQYPVFPWILANYESKDLDLSQPANYRDLSKPIGALNPSRKAYFEERYASWDHEKVPPFHYGTHYSTAAFVLNWMIRMEPFTTLFLTMQGGKFDHADRTFHSLAQAWKSCQRDTHDVKELIPEFYYLPEMLLNLNAYKFGVQDDGSHVNDVSLPPWAKSAEHFVTIHRQALESELVSCQIHQWIDLIFGYKQRGPEAVRATNVFYYLTYEGAVDLNNMEDSMMRKALEDQIKNFGQTPAQLLTEPHPPRQSMLTISPLVFNPVSEDLCMIMKFISNSPVVHLSPNTFTQLTNPTVVSIGANLGFAINKWNNNYSGPSTTPSFGHGAPEGQQQQQQQNQIPNLPLTVDPLLATGNAAVQVSRRHLGEAFDQRLVVKWNNFVTTVDSKFIFACGYTDYSFRVINTDQAKVSQTVYGHKDVVTCLARSECNIVSDCYLASGSKDCTVLLWHWNAKNQIVAGEYNLPGEIPAPRAVLTGHDNEITCVVVSAEHGIIISSSLDGAVLIHTTQGELLRSLESPDSNFKCPRIVVMSRECHVIVLYDQSDLCLFTTSGRLLKTAKADMAIQCLSLSRDGEYLIAGGGGELGNVAIHRLFELDKIYSFPPCDSPVKSVAVAQNHRFILAGLGSGAIIVFNVDFNKWHHDYENRYTQRSS